MLQKKIIFFLLFLLSSCGYEAIHSQKNLIKYNFSINKLELNGNRNINIKIKEKLNNYLITKSNKVFQLKISSTSKKLITAKNTAGDATSFQSTIALNVEVLIDNKSKNNFIITENFDYNNTNDKFALKRYEKEIRDNLAISVANRLIFKLANIQ